MNINELPEEILVRILSFLPRSDRLESALTCRRWAQTVARAPPLLRDIWLVIGIGRIEEARSVFANSQRQYENLRLVSVSLLELNAAFWKRIGPGLRELDLVACYDVPKVIYSILWVCSNLESLEILMCLRPVLTPSELPPRVPLERLQKSMRNLRHLHLHFHVGADTLERLFILMPNVSSIGLDISETYSSWLPKILGTSRKITALDLNSTGFGRNECEQLLRISSTDLRTLRYNGNISTQTELDELRNCSLLRNLDLTLWHSPHSHSTRLLQNIIPNLPEIETLRVSIDGASLAARFRREDLMPIFNLRKLRELQLHLDLVRGEFNHVPDEIVGDLSRIVSLKSLSVGRRLGIVDSTLFRILASTPNLRKLRIHDLHWDAECLEIVLHDLRKLRALEIKSFTFRGHFPRDNGRVLRDPNSKLGRNTLIAKDRQGEQKSSSLEVLVIQNIPLSDASLRRITAHHGLLRIVYFRECGGITDAGLVTLFQHEPLLEELTILCENNLDGTFLKGLGGLCRRLLYLAVPSHKISSQAEREFQLRRPRVKCEFWRPS